MSWLMKCYECRGDCCFFGEKFCIEGGIQSLIVIGALIIFIGTLSWLIYQAFVRKQNV